jgi:hypothetical protein
MSSTIKIWVIPLLFFFQLSQVSGQLSIEEYLSAPFQSAEINGLAQ